MSAGLSPRSGWERRAIDVAGRAILIDAPADPDALVRQGQSAAEPSPGYWANLWPSAVRLSEHLAASSILAPGARVLELGCGLGLAGIVAATRGASVTLTDFNPRAVEAAAHNARLNGVEVSAHVFDWNDEPPASWAFDLVIACDIFYEPQAIAPVARLLRRLDCPALVADPARPQSAGIDQRFRDLGFSVWAAPADDGRILMLQPREARV